MENLLNSNSNKNQNIYLGNKIFLLGVFFLPSALPISGIFLFISLVFSFKNRITFSLKDKLNYPLFISIGLIIFSTFNVILINRPSTLLDFNVAFIWLNLFNWIPIFIFYWGFQNYLAITSQRLLFAKFILSGTFPVIISCILQKFFNLYGPFKTLFGSIVWFQKPLVDNSAPISGLFSNPNYTSIWLCLVLPFSLILLRRSSKSSLKNIFLAFLSLLIIYMIVLTGSRNGIIAIGITAIILYGYKKFFLVTIPLFFLASITKFFGFFINNDINFFNNIFPKALIKKIFETNFQHQYRLDIWSSAFSRIQERPFLGWGPSTFSFLHIENNKVFFPPKIMLDAQHSHNIILELSHNFGIPLAIILVSSIFYLLLKSWPIVYSSLNKNSSSIIDKAWFSSSVIIFVSSLTDITHYDGKISIFIGALFAGLRCIIK